MDDNQLLRYSRHILLPEIGIEGQQRMRIKQALLALDADFRQQDMPAVAQQLVVVHGANLALREAENNNARRCRAL